LTPGVALRDARLLGAAAEQSAKARPPVVAVLLEADEPIATIGVTAWGK
jgi:hypothetical protein